MIEALDRILPPEEPEVGILLARVLESEGITVKAGRRATRARQTEQGILLELDDGSTVSGDRLLVATGRHADLASLGLASVGVPETDHWVPVDDHLRVTPGVWAVGDVTGQGAFTHIAMYQANIAAADILGQSPPPADYKAVRRVTLTDPEVGAVGLTEAAARSAGIALRSGVTAIPSSARGWIHKVGNEGLIKLVEDTERGVLVGATSMGPAGGEVLGMLTLAVHAEVPTASSVE